MTILLLSLLALFALALAAGSVRLLWYRRHKRELPAVRQTRPDGCCGQHETCEKDSLLAAVSRKIEYYDDEELDRYRGRAADEYTQEEIEEFRDVLMTLLPQDVAGWSRSIQVREINLPTEIREELIMIVSDLRR